MGQLFSFFKTTFFLFLFFSLSCSSSKNLNRSPENLDQSDIAHLTSLKTQLASSKDFYLELSIREKKISICHSGVPLRKYILSDIKLEKKRVLFIPTKSHLYFNNAIFYEGTLNPKRIIERVKVIPGDESTRPTPELPNIIPPTMEEIIPAPSVYDLDLKDSFSIRFILKGEVPGKKMETKKFHYRWNDFLIALGLKKGPNVRLKVELDSREGAAFFRSCPDKAPLLILP